MPSPLPDAAVALPEPMRKRLETLIESNKLELPVLPEVASQVIQLSFDEACEIKQLNALIQRDQSMAAHVLRLANSVMYGSTIPIVSLQQALARLGLSKIREIALMISCETKVFRVEGFDLRVRALYRHAIATAAYCQEVARLRRQNVEEAFLCGLLSDFGRPVLLQALVDMRKAMGLQVAREAIEAASGEFHCRVGAAMAREWKLPARLAESILHHHDPENANEDGQTTARAVRLANDLAHWAIGPKKVEEDDVRNHPQLAALNLYPEDVERLIEMRDKVLAIAEQIG